MYGITHIRRIVPAQGHKAAIRLLSPAPAHMTDKFKRNGRREMESHLQADKCLLLAGKI
jgi:hypothetical protein